MTLSDKIELKRGVVAIGLNDKNTLMSVDEDGVFREYQIDNLSLLNTFATNIQNNIWTKRISFSQDGEILVYGIPNAPEISIFSLSQGTLLYQIEKGYHQNEVLSTATDSENRYFISTSRDGRAFLWNIQTGNLIFSFPKEDQAINIAQFKDDNDLVALGTDSGKIIIYNISTMKQVSIIENESAIRAMLFLADKYIISLDKNNRVNLWRFKDNKHIKTLFESKSVLTKIFLSADEKFLFIANTKGVVSLYNLINHSIVNKSHIVIKNPITNIIPSVENKAIILSDAKGGIYFYSAKDNQALLIKYIKTKQYDEAYKLIQKNDMLKFTKEAEILEMIWEKTVKKSEEMLEHDIKDTIKVELMLEPFTVVPEKKEIVDRILNDFQQYVLLNKFIEKESYYLAYDIIEKHPSLKKTKAYKQLEAIWQHNFRLAKSKLFERNGEREVKEILSKFAGVTDKAFTIKNLFLQKDIYITFQNLIKKKKYNEVLKFVEKNRFLETNEDYQNIVNFLDDTFIQMRLAIRKGNFELAKDKAQILIGIDDFKPETEEALQEIEVHLKFQSILRTKNLNKILAIVEEYDYLKSYSIVQDIEKRWNKAVFEAQELASLGEIDRVREVLSEFETVEVRYRKMANIFKIAYLSDLHNTLVENEEHLEFVIPILKKGIEKYFSIFGRDQEIDDLIEDIRVKSGTKIDTSQFKVGNIDEWTPEKIRYSIIQ